MADVRVRTPGAAAQQPTSGGHGTVVGDNPQLAAREQRRRDRLKLIAEHNHIPRVRVVATRDDLRGALRHPASGTGFPSSGGSVEWPNDQFTKRRIRDGDVRVEESREDRTPKEEAKPQAAQAPQRDRAADKSPHDQQQARLRPSTPR
jgi:hypothetical protein